MPVEDEGDLRFRKAALFHGRSGLIWPEISASGWTGIVEKGHIHRFLLT